MPYHKHFFRCALCGHHVTTVTEGPVPWLPPGKTHGAVWETGDVRTMTQNAPVVGCLGLLAYCTGAPPCNSQHRGTEVWNPPPPPAAPSQEWVDFEARVTAGWQLFVTSNFAPQFRGANNPPRTYQPPAPVLARLRQAGGIVMINGGVYTVADSHTSGVSLHRPIPFEHRQGNMLSFIFHL